MRRSIDVPPPSDFSSFSPSELFRFFFQLGRWTEESFSDEFQAFTRGKLVSTVTLSKWKNKNVIPTRYSGAFFRMIEDSVEPAISSDWVRAFETVWAHHSAGRSPRSIQPHTSLLSDKICEQHKEWIHQLYMQPVHDSQFSASDIYVPLQLHDIENDESGPQDMEEILETADKSAWTFISGGPGSGKSMTALHLANTLFSQNIFPIYLRGSRLSDIDIDVTSTDHRVTDSFSMKSFLQHFRASSFHSACLILDGVDEINLKSEAWSKTLNRLFSELKSEQAACEVHAKNLRIIILGRNVHIRSKFNHNTLKNAQYFQLLTLDGNYRGRGEDLERIKGEDLRALWWEKYLAATGNFPDPSLPDFLTLEFDDFSEFGTDPLLTFLICETALTKKSKALNGKLPHERVNSLTYTSNKNDIYGAIIDRIARSDRYPLDRKKFLSVLQHIALMSWNAGGSRSVSLQTVLDGVSNQSLSHAFQTLNLSAGSTQFPPETLIAAFYYHLSEDEALPDKCQVEFTHKTFSEYLVSTSLFDAFEELISSSHDQSLKTQALENWIRSSHSGRHEPSLAGFCQTEARIRFDNLSELNWDETLNLVRDCINGISIGQSNLFSIAQIQNSASVLFFIWSCLNLERQKRTGICYNLSNDNILFDVTDLKVIQRPKRLNFELGSRIEPTLKDSSFLTQSLSGLSLMSADMSQLSFSLGHMENLVCNETSFALTYWSHVKLSGANLLRSVFQQAIFHRWNVLDTRFQDCLFQGSRFQGANFTNCNLEDVYYSQCHFSNVDFRSSNWTDTIFDRCVFTQCLLPNSDSFEELPGMQFRHCTFLDMEGGDFSQPPDQGLEAKLDKIL